MRSANVFCGLEGPEQHKRIDGHENRGARICDDCGPQIGYAEYRQDNENQLQSNREHNVDDDRAACFAG